jgi:hypothetical protein
VYLMHAGHPMLDDLLAVLYTHPHVHVDVGIIVFALPHAAFHRYLQAVVEAGFGKRVMFGSDQMVWPGVIERAIRLIEDAPSSMPNRSGTSCTTTPRASFDSARRRSQGTTSSESAMRRPDRQASPA